MAAPKYQRTGNRCDRDAGIHLDRDTIARSLAAIAGGMAAGRSDDSHSQQFRLGFAAEGIWDRSGNLGLSAVRDNIRSYHKGAPETEVNLLRAVLGPDIADEKLRALILRFGNTASLHFADLHELTEIIHDPQQAARLKAILQIAAEIGRPASIEHPVIKDCVDLVHYLQATMGDCRVERFRVLFLDAHNRMIADELLWSGTVSEVQVYPREVMRRALELDCSAFIAAHNHPSHAVLPSQADIEMTRKLLTAANTLGIAFHDHFIVSSNSYHSMRFHRSVDPWV